MPQLSPSRQPSLAPKLLIGLGTTILLLISSQALANAATESELAIGAQISDPKDLSTIPDGPHQFCSEPEPEETLGAGTCYWFTKVGNQIIGYYGLPHSDLFIDCVSGTIEAEKVVGTAIAISWPGAPLRSLKNASGTTTWKTLLLGARTKEFESTYDQGKVALINFNQAVLSLKNFYRYSPEKVALMNTPPRNCDPQEWINQLTFQT